MKILFLILLVPVGTVAQQGVAVGTGTPAASALLDIHSQTKGFLPPRMSQQQRTAIQSPAEGLLLFDTGARSTFQYRKGVWRYLLDNSYWVRPLNRKQIVNITDSTGIGNAAPVERLHLTNGNFRILGGGLRMENGDVLINNPTGRVQFVSSGVEKAFFQLSGNDLHLGINAGAPGNVRFTTGGLSRVSVENNDVAINGSGKLTRPETGDYNLIPYCYGIVASDATVVSGTGNFQVEKYAAFGNTEYRVRVEGIEAYSPNVTVLIVTPAAASLASYGLFESANGYFKIRFWKKDSGTGEADFQFLIYKK